MKPAQAEESTLNQLLAFTLDGQRYALRLDTVERVLRMVEVTKMPRMPEIVMGVIDWHGEIVPVLNMRKRFALPEEEPDWNDQLIIAHTSTRTVSLVVDSVTGVNSRGAGEITSPDSIVPGIGYVSGVAKLDGDLVFIHELDRFLSLEEAAALDEVRTGS